MYVFCYCAMVLCDKITFYIVEMNGHNLQFHTTANK